MARLSDAGAGPQPSRPKQSGRNSPIEVIVPAHLQDLKEGDLPESQRVAVLDQIAVFRENTARRERDKKHIDEEREREKERMRLQAASRQPSMPSGYGYGNRAFAKGGSEPASGRTPTEKTPTFVRAETSEGRSENERTDEEEEAIRRQRRERDKALALRDVSFSLQCDTYPSAKIVWKAWKGIVSILLLGRKPSVNSASILRQRTAASKWRTSRIGMTMSLSNVGKSCSTLTGEWPLASTIR